MIDFTQKGQFNEEEDFLDAFNKAADNGQTRLAIDYLKGIVNTLVEHVSDLENELANINESKPAAPAKKAAATKKAAEPEVEAEA